MDERWVRYYDEFATRYDTPAAQSGYVANDVPLAEGLFDHWVEIFGHRMTANKKQFSASAYVRKGTDRDFSEMSSTAVSVPMIQARTRHSR